MAEQTPAGGHAVPGHKRERSFARSIGLTVASAVVPGSGLLGTRRRKVGLVFLAFALIVAGFLVWAVVAGRGELLRWAFESGSLVAIAVGALIVGTVWVGSAVVTHISTRPAALSTGARIGGAAIVGVLSAMIMAPMVLASQYATVQRDFVNTVFAKDTNRSATVDVKKITPQDPWLGKNRVNILLLGGDGGNDRIGVRTDTMIVASIDTHTGNTVLLSLPRNLMRVPLPAGTALSRAYGGTFYGPGPEGNWMLNAMYLVVPQQHPELMSNSDHQAADIMKVTIGNIYGLNIDYFALVNLAGFRKIVDALGGITVNINYPVPVGGDSAKNIAPGRYLHPGPNQHLNGEDALWFARGRYNVPGGDYSRMDRQRCFVDAVINQANPPNVLRKYQTLIKTSKEIVSTDIPAKILPALVDLAMKVKDAKTTSAVFNSDVTFYAHPNYPKIKNLAQLAIRQSEAAAAKKTAATSKPKKTTTATSPAKPGAAQDVNDVCAYHPASSGN